MATVLGHLKYLLSTFRARLHTGKVLSPHHSTFRKSRRWGIAGSSENSHPMSVNVSFGGTDVTVPVRFRLKGELGRGGMAVVLHAYDQVGERDVALKFLPPTGDEDLRKRFQREAVDLANVYHKNVVDFYSLGESGGLDFIEMEYVGGGTLNEFIRRCESLKEELEVYAQIAEGLHHIHEAGLVHRDMKPANVLMTEDGIPKISDLGLARHQEGRSQLTQDGAVLGTAAYLAPEQLRSHQVDHRADLYAFGVCLFEAVTSTRPFLADNPLALMRAHFEEKPPAPGELIPGLPKELDALILQLMEKRPEKRPKDAMAVANQLRKIAATLTPAQDRLVTSSPQVLLARARYFLKSGDLTGASRILDNLDPGPDKSLSLQLDIEKTRATLMKDSSRALKEAKNVVAACRASEDLKLLGSALVVEGQAAIKEQDWEAAKNSLQEARELIPSNNQVLQLELLDSLASLHDQGSAAGHAGLEAERAHQFRQIADGIARRQDSRSLQPEDAPPVPAPAGERPSVAPKTAKMKPAADSKKPDFKKIAAAACAFLLLALAGGYYMAHRPAQVQITSDPVGATIMVDEERFVSPYKGELKPGPHKVKLFLQGYFPQEKELKLKPGQVYAMTATLKPSSGDLNLASKPKGAKVFVNGQAKGVTPLKLAGLPLKKFKVKFTKDGYKDLEKEVEVLAGKTRNLEFALTEIPPPPVYHSSYSGGYSSYSGGRSYSGGSSHSSSHSSKHSSGGGFRIPGTGVRVKIHKPKIRF